MRIISRKEPILSMPDNLRRGGALQQNGRCLHRGRFTYHKRSIVIERGKQEKIRCRIITFQTVTVRNGTDKNNTGSESKLLYQLFYFLLSISRADKKHAERYIP